MMTSNNVGDKDFQVALLMSDASEAKLLSSALREVGIFAHYYSDLEDFWVSSNSLSPDLCIIDVKKMAEGNLKLKQHPKIRKGSLKLAFYYNENTKTLLNSTFGYAHYGLIRSDFTLIDQLKNTFRILNEELRLKGLADSLENRIEALKVRRQEFSEEQEGYHLISKYNQRFNQLEKSLYRIETREGFQKRLIHFISTWDDCSEFGIYQLNSTGQKLVSPQTNVPLYKSLPDLWLSIPCREGIADFAQEMAFEVGFGNMGEGVRAITIKGQYSNPDYILLLKLSEQNIGQMNWSNLETKLTSELRRILNLENSKVASQDRELNIFDALQLMDDEQFSGEESAYRIASLNFSELTGLIKQNVNNRFSWKSFHSEFTSELFEMLKGDCKISFCGMERTLIFLDRREVEVNYQVVKHFIADFQYWRYFEDGSLVVAEECFPKINLIAPSAVNVLSGTSRSDQIEVPAKVREKINSSLSQINI